jgi:hypothetical protein
MRFRSLVGWQPKSGYLCTWQTDCHRDDFFLRPTGKTEFAAEVTLMTR